MPRQPFAFPAPVEDPFAFLAELSPAQKEKFREAFTAESQEAEAEADRDGWFTLEEANAEAREIIAAAKRCQNK